MHQGGYSFVTNKRNTLWLGWTTRKIYHHNKHLPTRNNSNIINIIVAHYIAISTAIQLHSELHEYWYYWYYSRSIGLQTLPKPIEILLYLAAFLIEHDDTKAIASSRLSRRSCGPRALTWRSKEALEHNIQPFPRRGQQNRHYRVSANRWINLNKNKSRGEATVRSHAKRGKAKIHNYDVITPSDTTLNYGRSNPTITSMILDGNSSSISNNNTNFHANNLAKLDPSV